VEPEYFIKIIDKIEYVFAKDENYGGYRYVPNLEGSFGYEEYLDYIKKGHPVGKIED
jgi:hypothetical protein